MDDAFLVRRGERLGDLGGEGEGAARLERAGIERLGERLALDELENQKPHVLMLLEAVDRPDPRMAERGQHPGLPLEPREISGILRQRVGYALDCDVPFEAQVACAINLAHAADAERGEDLVRAQTGARRETHGPPECARILSSGQAEIPDSARRRRRSASA